MYCPECGAQVGDNAKSCTKCGRSMHINKASGNNVSTVVKGIILVMVLALVAGAGYVVALQGQPRENENVQSEVGDEAKGAWSELSFDPYGISMEIPNEGWRLYFDARAQKIFEDDFAKLDVSFIGVSVNPDNYRVDNQPEAYNVIRQETVQLDGWDEEALYTVVRTNESGVIVNKHQLYFRRDFVAHNNYQRTYTYVITMTFTSGREKSYAPIFEHIIDSITLYDYQQ